MRHINVNQQIRTESEECRAFLANYQRQLSNYRDIQNVISYLNQTEVYFQEVSTFEFLNNKEKKFIERNIKGVLEMSERLTNTLSSLQMDKCHVTPQCGNMPTCVAVNCGHRFCCKQCRLTYFQTIAQHNNGENQCPVCLNNSDVKIYNL